MWTIIESPVGPLRLVEHHGALTHVEFAPHGPATDGKPRGAREDEAPVLVAAAAQLAAYFAGERRAFDLSLEAGGTPFQQRVWEALRGIGWGETPSYGAVAVRLGMTPAASRAVGLANGRNPIPIIVPCHRVIGANGTLTGYAGGLERKQLLLTLETDALF